MVDSECVCKKVMVRGGHVWRVDDRCLKDR